MAAVLDRQTDQVLVDGKKLMRLAHEKTQFLREQLGHEGPNLKWES